MTPQSHFERLRHVPVDPPPVIHSAIRASDGPPHCIHLYRCGLFFVLVIAADPINNFVSVYQFTAAPDLSHLHLRPLLFVVPLLCFFGRGEAAPLSSFFTVFFPSCSRLSHLAPLFLLQRMNRS